MLLTMGDQPRRVILLALQNYSQDLNEIAASIAASAALAGFEKDPYLPKGLKQELDLVTQAQRIIDAFTETRWQIVGLEIPGPLMGTIHASLVLFREDLARRLGELEGDPLAPPEALAPLRDRIDAIDEEITKVWGKAEPAPHLGIVRNRRLIKTGLRFPQDVPLEVALSTGEGQEIEFKREFPKQASDLAKEIAAFGSTNPGTIFLGIEDDGTVIGLQGLDDLTAQDALRKRVEGIGSNSVSPSLPVAMVFELYEGHVVARIKVPRGSQPMYYSNNIPYRRYLSSSRPAHPQEVVETIKSRLEGNSEGSG